MAFNNDATLPVLFSTSITHAINFLTRPLALIHAPSTINALQLILRSALQAAYIPSTNPRFILSFSQSSIPPRPVYAACIAAGITWSDWMRVLGGRDFDLYIQSDSTTVKFAGLIPRTITIWSHVQQPLHKLPPLACGESEIPISKLGQSAMQATLRATVDSALARARSRTLAQMLLESDHEEEADELFAMISNSAIISPTPTRERFHIPSYAPMTIPSPSPSSSSENSRSSSPVSTFSDFSHSSQESMTSVSSISTSFSSLKLSPRPHAVAHPTPVYVDTSKNEITRYSYQGGVSTVLTGGVMLGGPKSAPPPLPKINNINNRYQPPMLTNKKPTNTSNTGSWRRAGRF